MRRRQAETWPQSRHTAAPAAAPSGESRSGRHETPVRRHEAPRGPGRFGALAARGCPAQRVWRALVITKFGTGVQSPCGSSCGHGVHGAAVICASSAVPAVTLPNTA